MSEKKIKIISDGTIRGSRILNHDGELIPDVKRIEIVMDADKGMVGARITFNQVDVDIEAEPVEGPSLLSEGETT